MNFDKLLYQKISIKFQIWISDNVFFCFLFEIVLLYLFKYFLNENKNKQQNENL
jgi:hypothetical protein